ncbi:MAG: hypothetical protein CVT77_14940 [Alphaproteobacteria bacterium HGW-Alphaproteobacteria-16]|nr:MAG: hypothetical protein CVT77_14940 [Alphaproteobacteria bacterium HGW-Alphaproteobacteria-16]
MGEKTPTTALFDAISPSTLATDHAPGTMVVALAAHSTAHNDLIAASGARLVGHVAPDAAAARLARQVRLDLILFDATGMSDREAGDMAAMLTDWAVRNDCRIVGLVERAGIDAVAGAFLAHGAPLLCDAGPDEIARTLADALAPGQSRLHDSAREQEAERLRLLSEEVARLAQVLTQLTADPTTGVRDRNKGFRAEPTTTRDSDPDPRVVRDAIRARRLRDQYFAAELFADPAWDMLLDLYAARLEGGRRVSVSSLCIAAAVPPTTALRWIGTLHEAELFGREPDPSDKRRAHITLSDKAATAMRQYFAATTRAGLAPA